MSSQDGREGDEEHGTEPTVEFDAFHARRAPEGEQQRATQQTQSAYVFPEEYAASPGTVFPPHQPRQPPMPQYDGRGADPATEAAGGRPDAPSRRWRSIALFGGAVLVAAALSVGTWAAFESGSASAGGSSAGGRATNAARAGTTGADGIRTTGTLTFRVTIRSVGADSFTGTVLADHEIVTVQLNSKTRFGTKAHPFARSGLLPGETVLVHGRRTGADTVTATVVAADATAPAELEG